MTFCSLIQHSVNIKFCVAIKEGGCFIKSFFYITSSKKLINFYKFFYIVMWNIPSFSAILLETRKLYI